MEAPLLSIIVLTRDEEANLPFLLASAQGLEAEIWVVDSGSTDRTIPIAEAAGCRVVTHPFETQAQQLNWALETLPIRTPWVMRMDADERFTPELVEELRTRLPALPEDVTGLLVKRQVWFWGRWIRHGDYYPTWLLRAWRQGRARSEQRFMDEHMVTDGGRVLRLAEDIIDENHKGLGFWTEKHNRYADRVVMDLLATREARDAVALAGQAGWRRWAEDNLYLRVPPFLRAFLYWLYRYLFRLGFLDGVPGLLPFPAGLLVALPDRREAARGAAPGRAFCTMSLILSNLYPLRVGKPVRISRTNLMQAVSVHAAPRPCPSG